MMKKFLGYLKSIRLLRQTRLKIDVLLGENEVISQNKSQHLDHLVHDRLQALTLDMYWQLSDKEDKRKK